MIYTRFARQSYFIMNLRFMIVIYNPSKAKLVNNLRSDCEEGLSGLQTFFAIPTVSIRVSPPPVFYFFLQKVPV